MREIRPSFHKEEELKTVLEVSFPEEMLLSLGKSPSTRWNNLLSLMNGDGSSHLSAKSRNEFLALLIVVGAALVPVQVRPDLALVTRTLKDCPTEDSTAKYIVQQYVAVTGGPDVLNAMRSMCAMGQVTMLVSEHSVHTRGRPEVRGFVMWQKNPDLWTMELIVSGLKVSAGSDGKIGGSQSRSHTNKGPPRPHRWIFQGLDPRYTANLFFDTVYVGDETIEEQACFCLRLDTSMHILQEPSSDAIQFLRHKI